MKTAILASLDTSKRKRIAKAIEPGSSVLPAGGSIVIQSSGFDILRAWRMGCINASMSLRLQSSSLSLSCISYVYYSEADGGESRTLVVLTHEIARPPVAQSLIITRTSRNPDQVQGLFLGAEEHFTSYTRLLVPYRAFVCSSPLPVVCSRDLKLRICIASLRAQQECSRAKHELYQRFPRPKWLEPRRFRP